jgi:hypothetical protein
MKIATAIMDTALLDFIGAHGQAHGSRRWARDRRWVHARGAEPPDAEASARVKSTPDSFNLLLRNCPLWARPVGARCATVLAV